MRLLPLAAAALGLCACSHARPRTRTVISDGFAQVDARGLPDALDRARGDARRRAIENVAGVSVESTSRVEGAVTAEQRVTSRSRGFVESSKALAEELQGGMVRVRMRARVREGPAPFATVALRIPDGPLASGVARALREKRVDVDGGRGAPELTGVSRTSELPQSLIAGTTAVRANAVLTLKGGESSLRAGAAASGLDPDPAGAADKALEAAGYRAGLQLVALLGDQP